MYKLLAIIILISTTISSHAQDFIVPAGTTITMRSEETIDSRVRKSGYSFKMIVAQDVEIAGKTLIKAGSKATARVIQLHKLVRGRESASIIVELSSIKISRQMTPAQSFPIAGKIKNNERKALGHLDEEHTVRAKNGDLIDADIPVTRNGNDIILNNGSTLYFTLAKPISVK